MSVTDLADKPILLVDDDEELTALLIDYLGKFSVILVSVARVFFE